MLNGSFVAREVYVLFGISPTVLYICYNVPFKIIEKKKHSGGQINLGNARSSKVKQVYCRTS